MIREEDNKAFRRDSPSTEPTSTWQFPKLASAARDRVFAAQCRKRAWATLLVLLSPLLLAMKMSSRSADNPPGPYLDTCENITVVGTTLTATCKGVDGRLAPPS